MSPLFLLLQRGAASAREEACCRPRSPLQQPRATSARSGRRSLRFLQLLLLQLHREGGCSHCRAGCAARRSSLRAAAPSTAVPRPSRRARRRRRSLLLLLRSLRRRHRRRRRCCCCRCCCCRLLPRYFRIPPTPRARAPRAGARRRTRPARSRRCRSRRRRCTRQRSPRGSCGGRGGPYCRWRALFFFCRRGGRGLRRKKERSE